MTQVNDLVQKAVVAKNEAAQAHTERHVKDIVDLILSCEADIALLQRRVLLAKENLKSLEMPKPLTLSLDV